MTAVDAFTMRQLTYEQMHTGAWASFVDGFTASLRGEAVGTIGASGFVEQANEFSKRCVTNLSLAETFYVSPDMNTLVTAAAEGWEHDETVQPEDFPTDHGWLYIPGGLVNIDVRGRMYQTSALTWERHGAEVRVVLWADKRHDPPHMRNHPSWPGLPTMTPWHIARITLGETLPTALRLGKTLPPEVSEQIHVASLPDGKTMVSFPQGWTADEMQPSEGPDPVLAWLVTTLRIMQQPLVTVSNAGLPAGVRKDWKRNPVRVKNTRITVIDFRRRAGEYESGKGREFSHRFLRRGHWRRQPYKREDGTWDRRRIWIHPTVVGPADKPLMLRDHVNALTR